MMLLHVKAKKILIKFIMFSMLLLTVKHASFDSFASNVIGTAKVTADSLNVRSGPGKEYDTMGKLYSGNVVDVKAVEGDWLKIDYNSSDGYISIDYVEYEPDEELILEEEEEEVKEEAAEAPDETAETEDEPTFDYKFLFGLIGAIIVILIMILITIKSIKASDDDYDDEDDEDDDDDYYEDEYEDDEEEEEDDDEYEYVVVKRPRTQSTPNRQKPKSSDDFLIDIDPRYFD